MQASSRSIRDAALRAEVKRIFERLHSVVDHLHHRVENISEHHAVCAFKAGVRYRELYLKFGRTGDMSMSKMMEIVARYANGKEEDRISSGKGKAVNNNTSSNSNQKQKRKADGSTPVEAATLAAQG